MCLYFFQHSWFPTQCGVSGEVQGFGKEEFTTFRKSVKAGRMLEKMSSIIMRKEVESVIRYDAASIQLFKSNFSSLSAPRPFR